MKLYAIIIVVLILCFITSGCDVFLGLLFDPPQEAQMITIGKFLEMGK